MFTHRLHHYRRKARLQMLAALLLFAASWASSCSSPAGSAGKRGDKCVGYLYLAAGRADARGRPGLPRPAHDLPVVLRRRRQGVHRLRQLQDDLHRPGPADGAAQHGVLGASSRRSSPPAIGLLYAILVDKSRFESFAKALIFLPMSISFVAASVIWKFVYEYRPDQAQREADRPGQPDHRLARRQAAAVADRVAAEHVPADRRDDLDPGRLRHDRALRGDQGDPGRHHRGRPARRRQRLEHVPQHHAAEHPARPSWSC